MKKPRPLTVTEGVRSFPCPYCKGKGGFPEGEPDCSWTEPCYCCHEEGLIKTGSEKHRELFMQAITNEITDRVCRKNDDYYAGDEYLPRWSEAIGRVCGGLSDLFDLYIERYGKPVDAAPAADKPE